MTDTAQAIPVGATVRVVTTVNGASTAFIEYVMNHDMEYGGIDEDSGRHQVKPLNGQPWPREVYLSRPYGRVMEVRLVEPDTSERDALDAKLREYGVPNNWATHRYSDGANPDATRGQDERWVTAATPLVRIGDKVMFKQAPSEQEYEGIVIYIEPDSYSSNLPVLIWSAERAGGIYWPMEYRKVEEVPDLDGPVPDWVTENAPYVKPGDVVYVIDKDGARDRDNEQYMLDTHVGVACVVTRTLSDDLGRSFAGGRPLPIEVHPEDSTSGLTQYVGHYRVLRRATPEPVSHDGTADGSADEPSALWEARIQSVLDRVGREASERDWCSEYEDAMRELFDIEDPIREQKEQNWCVNVTISRRVDTQEYLDMETIFGTSGEDGDAELESDELTTFKSRVHTHVSATGEPSTDEVNDALTSEGFIFDDIIDYDCEVN